MLPRSVLPSGSWSAFLSPRLVLGTGKEMISAIPLSDSLWKDTSASIMVRFCTAKVFAVIVVVINLGHFYKFNILEE